jgi:DUF1680 family protein
MKRTVKKGFYKTTAIVTSVIMATVGINYSGFASEPEAPITFNSTLSLQLGFEDNLTDAAGKYTPEGVGTIKYVSGVNGKKAIEFDGDSYVNIGNNSAVLSEDMTLSFWIKAPQGGFVGEQMITWFKPDGKWFGEGFYLASASDTVPLAISLGASFAEFGQPYLVQITGNRAEVFPDGEWVHIALSYKSSTKELNVYRNGQEMTSQVVAETGGDGIIDPTTDNKWIGCNSPAYGAKSKFFLDEFEVYNSIATQQDVNSLYTKNGGVVVEPETKETPAQDETSVFESGNFDMGSVTMTDPYYVNAFEKEVDYLLSLDTGRLLSNFRANAGLSTGGKTAYAGWEDSLIGGHTIGHYLTACSQAYANAEISAEDKSLIKNKIDEIISGLKECQANTKGQAGYIFGAKVINQNNVEIQFDNVELNKTNITTEAWVPWYTMHKILAGVTDVYKLTGDTDALDIAKNLGDWTYNRVSKWSAATKSIVLGIEYGGMNDALYDLYRITGDSNHLTAAEAFDEINLFENVYNEGANVLNNKHANTTIPKFLGALNRYRVLKEKDLLTTADEKYLEYAKKFFKMVVERHSYVTGGNSEWEHFGADHILDGERTACNCETCNTYNMLKLARELFKLTGDKQYADYYENTLINAIMSSQNPDTGMSMYFQPMQSGYFKVYGTQFEDFWCCTGSGMENFTKLNDSIYFKGDNTVVVNLYLASELNYAEKGVILKQTTDFTKSPTAEFTVSTATEWNGKLMFRIPDWSGQTPTITINGVEKTYSTVNGYAVIEGQFSNNDKISLGFTMEVKAFNLSDNENTYAFKYGPFVLSANLGTENKIETTTGVSVNIPANRVTDFDYTKVDYSIGLVSDYIKDINTYLVKDANSLTFNLNGTDKALVFTPHYLKHDERYAIYTEFLSDDSGIEASLILKAKESQREEAALLDTVQPGYGQYENDELHQMRESNSNAITNDGTYRYALSNGYFTYDMIVDKTVDNVLTCSFKKADNNKSIKIYAGDTVIYNEVLNYTGDLDEYTVDIPVSKEILTAESFKKTIASGEKTVVDFKFSSADNSESAKVCSFIKLRKAYSSVAELKNVVSSNSNVTIKDNIISVVPNNGEKTAKFNFELSNNNGYFMINNVVADESKEQSIVLNGQEQNIAIRVYAENHTDYKDYTLNIKEESNIVYFVDCGDYDVTTVSDGDKFGTHNSVTDMIYQKDPKTGYTWGIIDNPENKYNGSLGVCTSNTWAYEFNKVDGVDKLLSNRYTKNQFENGIATRYLDYGFEIENGTYEVELGFADPWNVSNHPAVYMDLGLPTETLISADVNIATNPIVKKIVNVTNSKMNLNIRSVLNTTLAINLSYIIIKKVDTGIVDKIDAEVSDTVTVSETTPETITSDVFKKLVDTGKKLVYTVVSDDEKVKYSWTFEGDKITDSNIDLDLSLDLTKSYEDEITKLTGLKDSMFINFSHHGNLPGPALVKVYVGDKYEDGTKLFLFYFDQENNQVKKISEEALSVKDGYVEFTITHCSTYLLNEEGVVKAPTITTDTESVDNTAAVAAENKVIKTAEKTGDENKIIIPVLLFTCGIIACFALRRKKLV